MLSFFGTGTLINAVKELETMSLEDRVKEVMDEKIRPSLKADGGDAEVIEVEDGVVTVELKGACAGCPMSQLTMQGMIEKRLKEEIPEVEAVEASSAALI